MVSYSAQLQPSCLLLGCFTCSSLWPLGQSNMIGGVLDPEIEPKGVDRYRAQFYSTHSNVISLNHC